ncbi:transposase [Providencia stuartii]|nr:transposase [Providencia stuartii]
MNDAVYSTIKPLKPLKPQCGTNQNGAKRQNQQDHRNIKRRIRPMLGFKSFRRAQTRLTGIEIVSMLRKQPSKNASRGG